MKPEFARAIDPVFLCVIDVIERLNQSEALNPEETRARIMSKIDSAEALQAGFPGWELAKYALACWVDSTMIHSDWSGAEWFKNHKLEFEYFQTAGAFTEFYVKAKEANKLARKDALEVFFVCVIMGFEGIYGDPSSSEMAEQLGFPSTREEWVRKTAESLQQDERPPIRQEPKPIRDPSGPLEGKSSLWTMSIFAVICLIITFASYLLTHSSFGK
ncbi:MAG: DotU family type IV/VI secretion system protein [Pirellulales bacterium]|nr:DotU family type IV/VI secretion system protein [Pirellulales bacterium]